MLHLFQLILSHVLTIAFLIGLVLLTLAYWPIVLGLFVAFVACNLIAAVICYLRKNKYYRDL